MTRGTEPNMTAQIYIGICKDKRRLRRSSRLKLLNSCLVLTTNNLEIGPISSPVTTPQSFRHQLQHRDSTLSAAAEGALTVVDRVQLKFPVKGMAASGRYVFQGPPPYIALHSGWPEEYFPIVKFVSCVSPNQHFEIKISILWDI
ncbi:hypothetical protein BDDG_01936 [Blastomyces dermatitidis ATCC 18188]|uniref:Uncharacterized protein n=1 Tax=Ajellomyces dermatitidis (strain ATCC 18188 / CBS 674.68) TaxID=653446 RepID=F2T6Y6_AJEDA|nr:hypothetical protein BDDG_01936 [Blastomyces dermatitidis ATCC 18188]EQL37098.1 hypothetical protein BDFG_01395 [Blastomyces dermatitidis ATCC 26199]